MADLSQRFEAHSVWRARRRGALVAPLGATRLRALVEGPFQAAITDLIEQDLELAGVSDAIESVDRLVHYYQHLEPLLQHFVSLRDFYTPGRQPLFQAGTLYLDGRACELCVRFDDPDRHAALASLSRLYLVYCECQRRGGREALAIAAAVTAGDADTLMIRRQGVFYDRHGNDWDATVVKIVEHPIGVWQAFWSPYKRLARLLSPWIARSIGVPTQNELGLMAQVTKDRPPTTASPVPAMTQVEHPRLATSSIAVAVVVGLLGLMMAAILIGLLSQAWWQAPLALLGLMLATSGTSALLARLTLSQRTLAPLLDATGWAVNAPVRISLPFGATLTHMARRPKGSMRPLRDPFAEKTWPWKSGVLLLALLVGLILAWRNGHLGVWIEYLAPRQGAETSLVEPAVPPAESVERLTEVPAATPEPIAPSTEQAAPDAPNSADEVAESMPDADQPTPQTTD